MISGERQAARIRGLYLKTILQQDIAFFDTEVHTGEVIGRMSGDTVLIQDAIGEKVGKFVQLMATFFGGFIIAFSKGWLLTLVMLSSIPPLMITGGIMSQVVAKMASEGQNAYAAAAIVVEQTIGAIRTVSIYDYCSSIPSSIGMYRFFSNIIVCVCMYVGCFLYRGEEGCRRIQQISGQCL